MQHHRHSVSLLLLAFGGLAFAGCQISSGVEGPSGPGGGGGNTQRETPVVVDETLPIDPNGDPTHWPAIYRDYGPLYAKPGKAEKESATKPWSDWWYPLRSSYLFRGDRDPAPLQKYDRYVREVYRSNYLAADYEEKNIYNPGAESWEGLCHAWAAAALLFPEPTKKVKAAGIEFTVADQKALLVKTYEQYVHTYYGRSYVPNDNGSAWSNIPPHLFHRFVAAELIEKGRPFIMNKVPGMEVWNTPVYKAALDVRRDASDATLYHVSAALTGAAVLEAPSDKPETRPDVMVYTYDLVTRKDSQGRDFVVSGKWTGVSVDNHPSVLIVAPKPEAGHQSMNPWIENEIVRAILSSRSDS